MKRPRQNIRDHIQLLLARADTKMTAKEIAAALDIPVTSVSTPINELIGRGYVKAAYQENLGRSGPAPKLYWSPK